MGTFKKRCPNCQELYEGRRCPRCANAHSKKRQSENEARKLYGSGLWRQCRKNAIIHYLGMDIWQLGAGVEYVCRKPYVHHIVERDEAPELIYRLDNLITVTKDSHEEIHRYYETDKQYALERITKGIETFNERYGK